MYWVSQNLWPKPSLLNIFQNFLQKWTQSTLYSSLIPMTSHLKIFILVVGVPKGVPKPKKKILWYLKIISTRVCKKIFLIKAKKNFVLGVPKFRTKTFIFEYFPKSHSDIKYMHSFYSILIPMPSHANIFILFVGGPQGVPDP